MVCLFHIVVFTNGSFVALEREGLVGISYSKEAKDQNICFLNKSSNVFTTFLSFTKPLGCCNYSSMRNIPFLVTVGKDYMKKPNKNVFRKVTVIVIWKIYLLVNLNISSYSAMLNNY